MGSQLDAFGRPMPPKRGEYYTPGLTADAVVFRKREDSFHDILLVTRKYEPYAGYFALPGGYIQYNEEPHVGCLRELKEETNLDGKNCQLICVRGHPLRAPQEHVVTVGYLIEVDQNSEPKGGDDAADAQFYPLQEILKKKDKVGFDHYEIILDALPKLEKKYDF